MSVAEMAPQRPGWFRLALTSPSFVAGAVIAVLFILVALGSFVWTPYDYAVQDIPNKLKGLSAVHWFGTDQYGRDVFSQILVGARTSIAVALVAVGLGVGLGTVRTSSFPVALLANVGIPGTIFYVLFAVSAFFRRRGTPRSFPSDVRMAARNACLALIIGDTFAAPNVEQGLVFYVLAAVACAEPEREYDEVELATQRLSGARA